MEELLKFYEAMMKLRFGTGFSAWVITIACNDCGYTVIETNDLKDDINQATAFIKTPSGHIGVRVHNAQAFTARFIPSKCCYPGKHDEYEVSYSLKPGQVTESIDRNSGIVTYNNITPSLIG